MIRDEVLIITSKGSGKIGGHQVYPVADLVLPIQETGLRWLGGPGAAWAAAAVVAVAAWAAVGWAVDLVAVAGWWRRRLRWWRRRRWWPL